MSDIISADLDKFDEAIASINNVITDIEGVRAKLNQADESLRNVWRGKSSDAYFENSEIISFQSLESARQGSVAQPSP